MFSQKPLRNQLIIDGPVQWTMVARIFVHWLAFACTSLALGWLVGTLQAYWRGGQLNWELLVSQQAPFIAVTILMLPVFLLDTITLSHKFVGPMYRFRHAIHELIGGDLATRLDFRPGDYWHDIARDFNMIADRINRGDAELVQDTAASEPSAAMESAKLDPTPAVRGESHQKRTRNFIDRHVQGGMLRRILGHWCVYVIICGVACTILHWFLNPLASFDAVFAEVIQTHGVSLLAALLLVPLFAADTIRMTHRIAGPMYRVRRELRQLATSGRASRVAFRPTDMWQHVATEFNNYCDFVEPRLASVEVGAAATSHAVAPVC